jgi:hypothetical protein
MGLEITAALGFYPEQLLGKFMGIATPITFQASAGRIKGFDLNLCICGVPYRQNPYKAWLFADLAEIQVLRINNQRGNLLEWGDTGENSITEKVAAK